MLKYVNTVITNKVMKSLKVFSFTGHLIRKLGLTKLYYWFNK